VRLPRPDTHILVALQEPTRVQGSPGGPRVLSIDSPGFLPGPARKRRPKPPNRPVRFLDADGTDRGQARAFLGDQVFVAAKTGHDTVGFTASLSAHAVALALVAAAIVARPVLTPTPPSASLVMVTPAAPPPPVVEVPPPSAAKPRPVPQRAVDVPQTVVPTAPPPAPIEVPPALPTGDNSAPTLPVTPVEPIAPVVVAPPVPLTGNAVNASVTEVPVDDFDQEPQLIKRVQAKVPAGASGTVRVEVVVSSYGKVTRVRLLDPTPYAAAVTEAAAQCEFRPARRRGKAVMVFYQLNFKLETK
jgi:TonB family protein